MAESTKSYDFLQPPTQAGDLGTLGHYRVLAELGRGGMGFVFRAEDSKLQRSVALKVMNQRIAATPHSRQRFIHEARAMAAVHHDNVATIFEVGEANGIPFMAMEMLKGQTLETFNKANERLSFDKIIDYARQIARGLAAAHANGIVHRDIKPANIWIEEGIERIKILDFGLALASTPVDHLAGRGAVIGTPGYLSPEQARSEPLDDRTDLYSMGVVLYELCTGKLPIQAKSVPGQLISILAHRPIPINEINSDIPQPLCDLIHGMLRKEPRSRPSSAVQLQADLDRAESECHAKSEVAQAINKLQIGLSEVVNKSSDAPLFDTVEVFEEAIPDPLAAAPAPVTMVPPVRPAAQQPAAPAAPGWQAYWPFAAIVAVVLIALPVLTFAFSGAGKDEAYVVNTVASNPEPSAGNQAPSNPSEAPSNNNRAAQNRQENNAASKPKNGQRKAGPRKNQNRKRGNGGQQNAANRKPAAGKGDSTSDAGRPPARTNGGGNSAALANLASVAAVPAPKADLSIANSTPPPESAPQPAPQPQPATVETKWLSISTAKGRGADVMVQKSGSQKLGAKPSIGIGMRGNIETHHSYLQFDLASIGSIKPHIRSAQLILTPLISRDPPSEVEIRVYGIPDLGVWQEEVLAWKDTYSNSKEGIHSFPLLAELRSRYDELESFANTKIVRISTPELAKFVAASGSDTVNFVIAGSAAGVDVVRFVSRNHPSGNPPTLRLEAPSNPPPNTDRNSRR